MNYIKKLFISILSIIILIPIILFNFKENSVSEIDNRYLTNFPLGYDTGDLTSSVESYINDRIGLRDVAISNYTEMNDTLFQIMEHPLYTYGKDGWVFSKISPETDNSSWLNIYVQFIAVVQDYCQEKNIPFIYVLEPKKNTIYQQYLPEGYNYKNDNLKYLIHLLDKYHINYISNVDILAEKSKTELVYNKQYDANHWNDVGAFYGVNNIVSKIQQYYPEVELLSKNMFDITSTTVTSLLVSKYPINEEIPVYTLKERYEENGIDVSEKYSSNLEMDSNYNTFYYYKNKAYENNQYIPKALFFQGSYMNGHVKYLWPLFEEYIGISEYQNILNYKYYIEKFDPEIVIFECAEYVMNDTYFDSSKMKEIIKENNNE